MLEIGKSCLDGDIISQKSKERDELGHLGGVGVSIYSQFAFSLVGCCFLLSSFNFVANHMVCIYWILIEFGKVINLWSNFIFLNLIIC